MRRIGQGKRGERGQGMTEYIIIVALVAVAAIAMVGFFGDTIRSQFYIMTAALAGKSTNANAATAYSKASGQTQGKGMGNFAP